MKRILFLISIIFLFHHTYAQRGKEGNIRILYTPGQPLNSFIPSKNIGGAIDGHFKGDIDQMITSANIKTMLSVGLKPVSYRLRTELAGEVWHWNPKGKWSDSMHQQGYWISDTTSEKPILLSYGYRLPRRGNTHDQANNDGYSKIDDGDTNTFWKSNPYLDSFYTHESNKQHPQWIIIDLGKQQAVNAIKIKCGNPYPLSYQIDYARNNDPEYFDPYQPGIWFPFRKNAIDNSNRVDRIIQICNTPQKARFIRVFFTKSSGTCDSNSTDIRDKLGFAIKEIEVGKLEANGKFRDLVHHAPNGRQSVVYVSSTDCWHTEKDLDPNVEQLGIDRFFTSGLTSKEPAMLPAALLYDSPENVCALVEYLLKKRYPVDEVEMGEEPEGQMFSPIDYAALYSNLAKKIHAHAPDLKIGGPSFASLSAEPDDSTTFTESRWTSLFLNYLKEHSTLHLFNFFSFEWYPFDDLCKPSSPQLLKAPEMLSQAMLNIHKVLPQGVPMDITEYGYSAYEGKREAEIEGGLMYADILGEFLNLGGGKSFLYGYEPAFLQQSTVCGFGNNMLFGLGDSGKIKFKTSAFYMMQSIINYWAQPAESMVEIYPAKSDILTNKKQPFISAYCLRAGDGQWRIMLINKDPRRSLGVKVNIENTISGHVSPLDSKHLLQLSKKQYHWVADGMNSHPSKSQPPVLKNISEGSKILLPPYSFTILY